MGDLLVQDRPLTGRVAVLGHTGGYAKFWCASRSLRVPLHTLEGRVIHHHPTLHEAPFRAPAWRIARPTVWSARPTGARAGHAGSWSACGACGA